MAQKYIRKMDWKVKETMPDSFYKETSMTAHEKDQIIRLKIMNFGETADLLGLNECQ